MFIVLILLASLVVFEAFPSVFNYSSQVNKITGMAAFEVSGVTDAMKSVFDIIFKGFLGPIDDALGDNQLIGVKLGLAIILYFLISIALGKKFKEQERIAKIISAVISIMFVILVSEDLLKTVFVEFLGGLLGLALLVIIIYLPTKFLNKWSKDNGEDRFIQGSAAIGQFILLVIIASLLGDLAGFVADNAGVIGSLIAALGIFISFIFVIIYLSRAFKGSKTGEVISEGAGAMGRGARKGYEKGKEKWEEKKEAKEAKKEAKKPILLNNAKQVINAIDSYVNNAQKLHQKYVKKGNAIKPRKDIGVEDMKEIKDQINHAREISIKNKRVIKSYFKDDPIYPVIKSLMDAIDNGIRDLNFALNQVIARFYDEHPEDFKYDIAKIDDYFGRLRKNINEVVSKLP